MKETRIEIGPNERKEELADNKGEWLYRVYVEKKPETAPPSGSSPTPN
jgi:hypothetical protein